MQENRYRLVLSALVVLFVAPMLALAQADADRITVAAYNLENAFDVFDDPYTADEGTDVKQRWELEAIAKAIGELDADVVLFSELESEGLLKAMVSEFLPDAGYKFIAVQRTNDRRGINLGIISRLPVKSLTSYRLNKLSLPGESRTWYFARDLLHAQIDLGDDKPLHLLGVHFKSRGHSDGDTNSTKWRSAEATFARGVVAELIEQDADARVLIAGDFNASPHEDAAVILTRGSDEPTPLLTDLHTELPLTDRITYPSDRYPNTIFDYVLASPSMAKAFVKGSAVVLKDEDATRGSDHRPVAATFDLSK